MLTNSPLGQKEMVPVDQVLILDLLPLRICHWCGQGDSKMLSLRQKEAAVRLPNPDCVSDVTLPNAFGVVARFEKADRMGCNEVGGVNVLLNGLEGMAEANG